MVKNPALLFAAYQALVGWCRFRPRRFLEPYEDNLLFGNDL